MDAVKFVEERRRMYKSGAATPSIGLEDDYDPVSAVEIVEKWAAAHPRKTRQSVFLEQYPEAKLDGGDCLELCPCTISAAHRDEYGCCALVDTKCFVCRREFWTQEVE